MKKTTALVFDHRNRAKDGQKGQIEVRVTVNRRSHYFGTGIRVHRSEWVAGRIVNCAGADRLNDRIAIIYNKVIALVNESIAAGEAVNMEAIRRSVWAAVERDTDDRPLLTWIHEQIPLLPVSEGTRRRYYSLEPRLAEFGQLLRWEDVTTENIIRFDIWLHGLRKQVGLTAKGCIGHPSATHDGQGEPLSDAGVFNYHKTLKALLARADRMGRIERNPYDLLRGQFKKGVRESTEYLTEDEVERIRRATLPTGGVLDAARDLFIFQVFTGLAYSDAQAFDIGQYRREGGTWRHVGERIKTGVAYVSELLPPAVAVIEKYGGRVPHINNSDYNRRLKTIGAMLQIPISLHSHLARHTFATMMLRSGAKIENVSRMLGHTNITQTQRYAKVLAQSVHEDFERVRGKWE